VGRWWSHYEKEETLEVAAPWNVLFVIIPSLFDGYRKELSCGSTGEVLYRKY
jgi:hypothetical protein